MLRLATRIVVRTQGKRDAVQLWDGTRPDDQGPHDSGGSGEQVSVLAVLPEGAAAPTEVAEVKLDRETCLSE